MTESTDLVRASDAERDAVAARLNAAVGEGRLTLEEYGDRVAEVYAARTRGDLAPLLHDLPASVPASAVPVVAPAAAGALFGPIKRGGRWRLDTDTELGVVCGAVKLDLRGAEITAPDITLGVHTVFGTIKVWVPHGVRVIVDGTTVVGGRRVEENHLPSHVAAPTLRLRLDTVVGTVKVYRAAGGSQISEDRWDAVPRRSP
jgi:hypothetical protein